LRVLISAEWIWRALETYKIESELLNLEIAIIDITCIHMHEETIPEAVQKLAAELLRDKVLKDPVMVDKKTLVVLDGMHRAAALRMVGCVRIPVCLVDYDNPSIRVETWYRTFTKQKAERLIKELMRMKIQTRTTGIPEAKADLEDRAAAALIATTKECIIIKSLARDLRQDYQLVTTIEQMAKSLGYDVSYETENDAFEEIREENAPAILGPPPIRKEDVREFGIRDDPFPHKATRHLIPARPLGVNVPLEMLQNQEVQLAEVNRKLIESLKKRQLQKLEAGSLIENRRYEEQVFLFK
jgi:hypothetical protein